MVSQNAFAIVIQLILAIVALFRVYIYVGDIYDKGDTLVEVVDGVLINYPKTKKGFQYLTLNGYKIVTSRFPKYDLGSELAVTPYQDKLLWPKIEVIDLGRNSFLGLVSYLHNKVINRANKLLPMPYSSLFLGMVFGIDQELPDDLYGKFYNGGVLHVIVASGYNVSVLLAVLFFFLKYLNKYIHLSVAILFLIMYLLLSGVSAPLVRAFIMGIFLLIARLSGVYINTFLILVATFNIMLIINPSYVESVSFWMSIVAMTSLILSSTFSRNNRDPTSTGFYNGVKESFSVNLFLFPVTSYFFGIISLGGLIANPLSLWLVPFVMVLGAAYFITGSHFLGILTIGVLDLFINIVNLVGTYIDVIQVRGFTLGNLIVSYIILFFFFFVIRYVVNHYEK